MGEGVDPHRAGAASVSSTSSPNSDGSRVPPLITSSGEPFGQQAAVAHAEVARLEVVGDERERRLLRHRRVAVGEPHADPAEVEQRVDLLVLGLLGHGRVAPRVAPALAAVDPEVAAHAPVQPLGQALGGLHAEAVDEELLGELAVLLELGHQLGHLVADRDGLQRDDVELAGVLGAEEVGQRQAVALGLARAVEALELGLAVVGVEHHDLVALAVAGEVAEQRARVQVVRLAPHALQARAEVVVDAGASTPRPSRRARPSAA